MPDPLDSEPTHPPSWDSLQASIHWWLIARFGLREDRDKNIWLYCIGAAMELERLAVGVLWIADGQPKPFYEYAVRMTLGQAYLEIEKLGLFDAKTLTILKDVSNLRNSVAHRHAIFVTAPSPIEGLAIGEYKGRHVFNDPEALDELMQDTSAASLAMYEWMVAKAPDLAEEAKRSGAHPTPP